ncbi:hypothetical protein ABZP36_030137 [Zizania latifolia]
MLAHPAPAASSSCLMNPAMASNGGMASPFFPANFLLQMQQPLPHHHHQHQEHHHLLPPPPPSLSTFLHDIVALKGGATGGGSSCRQEAASELINLNVKETEASCSNRSENSSEINLDISRPAAAAAESPINHHRSGGGGIPFYASVGRGGAGVDIDQLLLRGGHSPSPAVAAPPKMELGTCNSGGGAASAATSFGNLLCGGVDEQPPFWPWADGNHHFH